MPGEVFIQSLCPVCRAEMMSWTNGGEPAKFACGSEYPLVATNANSPIRRLPFKQSDVCKIRQRDALLAECFGLLERYRHSGQCGCDLCQKLAALRTRYEELKR